MTQHTRIKLCGMTRSEDVQLAVQLRVDCIGLIFAARSPRRLPLAEAAQLRRQVPATIKVVALLMDTPATDIVQMLDAVQPDVLQFHGSEDDACCAGFGLPFFKAIAMGDDADPLPMLARFPSAAGFVLDGHGAGEAGGSGRRFDWTRLPAVAGTPLLLAGGLRPDNVADAIAIAHPWGVDVSSGIERAVGVKDADAMRRFVAAVRAADAAAAAAIG